MALVYRLSGIVLEGRLKATFLLHNIEHDYSYTIDSCFNANLPEGPWEFTIMAAAGDLVCVRGRHLVQRDVLMLFSPQQQAWRRLPVCSMVHRFKRVGMSFHKDVSDHYKVLAVELNGDTIVSEVFDSRLEAWGTATQQEKQFNKLLGRCEFDHENQEFYHLVVKEQSEDEENVYSMICYNESVRGWHIVDMNLPVRMSDNSCDNDHLEGYDDRSTERSVMKASLVGGNNSLKLMVKTSTVSWGQTYDFEQRDDLVYEYDKVAGKWHTLFLCSHTDRHYSWKEKVNQRKYRWLNEGSRWYPAVIGASGRKNAIRIDCSPGSDSESDIGSGEHVVPPVLMQLFAYGEHRIYSKRFPRRKLPRGGGDMRMKPSEEACTLMLESLGQHFRSSFGHGNKVFMVSKRETRTVMYDCISHKFSVLHLSEPCVLRKETRGAQFANWDPVCIDLVVNNSNVWKQHGFSIQEDQRPEELVDRDNDKLIGGNGLLVYDMTSTVTGTGRLIVKLIVHDVVEDKSRVINLDYDAGLQDVIWNVRIVAAAGCLLCFRCKHATHGDIYLVCKPACNLWQLLPPTAIGSKLPRPAWRHPVVAMSVDDAQASYKVLVSTFDETGIFDSEACSWISLGKGLGADSCKFDNAFGGFLALEGIFTLCPSLVQLVNIWQSCLIKWEPTGIQIPKLHASRQQLFGSQDRTMMIVPEHGAAGCVVYGLNTSESRLEPIHLNKQFVEGDEDLRGAIVLEELEGCEMRELVLGATECFGRGNCIFWVKNEDERVVMYDCVNKQFKVLHIVKPWGIHKDGHRRVMRDLPDHMMMSGYVRSVYLCMP